ncbi:MAG: transposase [Pseudomonadota bacterium]
MSALLGELDYLRDMAVRLQAARRGEKGPLVRAACTFLRCSAQELYRRLGEVGYQSGRKPRADRGRTAVPEEIARKAAGMVHVAGRANGKKTLAIKDTLEILKENGHGVVDDATGEIMPIQVSASTLARAMRRYQCHPDQLRAPSAHVSLRSLHPNHVWQIDASVCVLFYLPRGGLAVMEEKEFYKNKPQNIKRIENDRVIRYVVTDHASGAVYLEYVAGSENAQNLTHVFLNAIQARGADDPMHGVPFNLMMDPGSANTSGLFMNLLERLQVNPVVHLPGNARVTGQVEKTHDLVECRFEGRLAFHQVADFAELNARATQWRKVFNATARHSRHGQTRNAMWLTIKEGQLRRAPALELCRDLVTTRPAEVTVRGDLTISHAIKGYGSNDYDVRYIPDIAPRQKLRVVVNPYRAPAIDVLIVDAQGTETAYTVEPKQKDGLGFYVDAPVIGESHRAQLDSPADTARKAILQDAYGTQSEREVDAKRRARTPAFDGKLNIFADVERTEVPTYLPRRGTALDLPGRARETAPLTITQAAIRLKQRLGRALDKGEFERLNTRFPHGVPEEALETLIEDFGGRRGGTDAKAHLMIVGGA